MYIKRESVFVSAFRAFLSTIGMIIGVGVAVLLLILAIDKIDTNVDLPSKATLLVSADANGKRDYLASTVPVIARINIEGVIGTRHLDTSTVENLLLSSREGILSNDRVKGILLYVNSPGGAATDSYNIYRLLKDYKEKHKTPIFAYVEGLCASGGMMISCAADQIYASQEAIVGSVGVRFGPAFNVADGLERLGVISKTFTMGIDKDDLNPFRKWKEGEGEDIQAMIASSYETFTTIVSEARKNLSKEALTNQYGARIFSASTAQEYGYIDEAKATYDQTLRALVKATGLADEAEYQVFTIKQSSSLIKDFSEQSSNLLKGRIEHHFPMGPYMTPELSGKLLYLYQP